MDDPLVLVALITGLATIAAAKVNASVKRAGAASDAAVQTTVQETGRAATVQADQSARQVGFDVGDVIASAVTAAVKPVTARLEVVEGEVRVLRGDLVPVAVADRGIVLAAVADGLVHRDRVLLIPDSVATLYPHHLRHIPHPTPSEENPS